MDIILGAIIVFCIIIAAVVIFPTAKMALDMAPFLYTNTRIAGRTASLLKKKFFDSALASSYMNEVYALLENTVYNYAVEHGKDFQSISSSLDKNLYQTYLWLENVLPKELAPVVTALKLKFEVNEIKYVLNCIREKEKPGSLHYISDSNLRLKLEAVTDNSSFMASIEGTKYDGFIQDMAEINTDLDRYYYREVLKAIEGIKNKKAAKPFVEYWHKMIDLANIRLVLRKIESGSETVRLLDGGDIAGLESVSDKNQLLELLQNTPYGENLQSLDNIEHSLFESIRKEATHINAKYQLTGGSIVKYMIDKELEIRNLNILLKLKSENIPSETISKMLVMSNG